MIWLILKLGPQYFDMLGVISHLGSRSKSRLAKFQSLTLTLTATSPWARNLPIDLVIFYLECNAESDSLHGGDFF